MKNINYICHISKSAKSASLELPLELKIKIKIRLLLLHFIQSNMAILAQPMAWVGGGTICLT